MVFKRSITSKLIHGCKLFERRNGDNLLKTKLLLFAINSTINNLSDQLSY